MIVVIEALISTNVHILICVCHIICHMGTWLGSLVATILETCAIAHGIRCLRLATKNVYRSVCG